MPDFHHDLRRSARFMPPDLGLPTTLRLQRGLDALARSRRTPGVPVIPLTFGASIRVHRPPAAAPNPAPALLWIHGGGYVIGSLDLFRDEDVRHAERLNAAGVPCELEVIQGAYHGFDAIAPRAAVSRLFFQRRCDALTSAFSG